MWVGLMIDYHQAAAASGGSRSNRCSTFGNFCWQGWHTSTGMCRIWQTSQFSVTHPQISQQSSIKTRLRRLLASIVSSLFFIDSAYLAGSKFGLSLGVYERARPRCQSGNLLPAISLRSGKTTPYAGYGVMSKD
jgi:hypothetical protein